MDCQQPAQCNVINSGFTQKIFFLSDIIPFNLYQLMIIINKFLRLKFVLPTVSSRNQLYLCLISVFFLIVMHIWTFAILMEIFSIFSLLNAIYFCPAVKLIAGQY